MLAIYRRHQAPCPYRSRRFRNCKCPIWVQGSLQAEYVRRSLDLRSWEAATEVVRAWEASGKIGERKVETPTVREAIDKFLADATARNLRESSLKKYRRLLLGELLPYCTSRNTSALDRLTVEFLREFRDSLSHAAVTQQKKLEYLRAFTAFCQASNWIATNPARAVKLPRVQRRQVKPFTAVEIEKLLKGCKKYRGDGKRMRAMILLLRSTGLRISDAVALARDRVKAGRLFLYASKTGTPVWCPLPREVVRALQTIPGETRFFWSGKGDLKSAIEGWRRRLVAVADLAKIDDAHFHRFRHSFSVALLEKGVPVEMVAMLLGNTPAIVVRHYGAFVKSRQKALEAAIRHAWR